MLLDMKGTHEELDTLGTWMPLAAASELVLSKLRGQAGCSCAQLRGPVRASSDCVNFEETPGACRTAR
jgi:hypothetical protein